MVIKTDRLLCYMFLLAFLSPVYMYPFFFWIPEGDFLLRFSVPSTRIRRKRSPKRHLFKNALQSEDFWKRWLLVYVWTDENRGFRIRWCHIALIIYRWLLALRMLCEVCYRISIVQRFRLDGRFEYATCGCVFVWKRGKKNLRFQKYPETCGRGFRLDRA